MRENNSLRSTKHLAKQNDKWHPKLENFQLFKKRNFSFII